MKKPKKAYTHLFQIAILVTAATLMQLISALQYYDAREEIRNDLEHNAEMELLIKALTINESLASVKSALRNHLISAEQLLPYPDSLFNVTRQIVELNPDIIGCSIGMVPDYYPQKGRLFEPYTARRDSTLVTYQLASEEHDYSQNELFINSAEKDSSYWSEPYADPYDPNLTLVTYTYPLHDAEEKVVGVMAVDLPTTRLGTILNARHSFPSSYNLLLSAKGQLICGPNDSNLRQDTKLMVSMINDSTIQRQSSSSGHTQLFSFIDPEDNYPGYVYYCSPRQLRPWKIAVIHYEDEVFQSLDQLRRRNLLLMLVGLLIMTFIIHSSAKNINKLQKANIEQEHINSELNIARNIQMSMLPKSDAASQRDDCTIIGSLAPAKMVGGDLYSYHIRNEKLFFCIGDVSGKGVPAALVMAVANSLFRSVSAHETNPAHIMQAINEIGCQRNDQNMFVTFFIGVLDLPTGKLRYCNAGHEKPFVIGKEAKCLAAKPHLPLGVMDDMIYTTQETVLLPGEHLFLYTDGLSEAKNENHDLFGIARIEKVLQDCIKEESLGAEKLIQTMTNQVQSFVDGAEQSDDLTMLAVQYTPIKKQLILCEKLTIGNNVGEITKLNTFVQSATTSLNMEKRLANQIKLAVEEAVTNVIDYAYPNGTEGNINLTIEADESRIRFILSDSGAEFDPTSVNKADTTLTVDERPIGGLGVFLVRNLMDSINYERTEGKNVLRMEKKY